MSTPALDRRITLSADALFQEIGGDAVILDLRSASYFGLDGVGVRFWQLAQADASLRRVHEALLQEYAVEPQRLEQDLLALVEQLVAANLATLE